MKKSLFKLTIYMVLFSGKVMSIDFYDLTLKDSFKKIREYQLLVGKQFVDFKGYELHPNVPSYKEQLSLSLFS